MSGALIQNDVLQVSYGPKDAAALAADLNGNALSRLTDFIRNAPKVGYVETVTASVANDPFVVSHALGVTPKYVAAVAGATGGAPYYTEDDFHQWTDTTVTLRSAVTDTWALVRVEA